MPNPSCELYFYLLIEQKVNRLIDHVSVFHCHNLFATAKHALIRGTGPLGTPFTGFTAVSNCLLERQLLPTLVALGNGTKEQRDKMLSKDMTLGSSFRKYIMSKRGMENVKHSLKDSDVCEEKCRIE